MNLTATSSRVARGVSDAGAGGVRRGRRDGDESLRVGRYLAVGLGAVLVLLAAIVGVAVYSANRVNENAHARLVGDAFPIRFSARDLVTGMVDEETGVRGFVITGQDASLGPFITGRREVARDLEALQPHLAAHPTIARLVAAERQQIAGLDSFFASEIALTRSGAAGRLQAQQRVLGGKTRFDGFRRTANRVDGRVARLVVAAERSQSDTFHQMVWLVALLGGAALVLGVGIAAVLLRVTSRSARRLERAAIEREERAAELERSNAQLQEFAYVASHDLSEPLRAVAGFAQLLGRRYQGRLDGDADEFISFIVDGASRMQRLISDLLDYSRAGRGELHIESVDCAVVVDRVLATMQDRISASDATVVTGELPTVVGDEVQLERVFQNLVGNALKFIGDDEALVEVTASRFEEGWRFCVADRGIGVPVEQADRVFRMFQRLNTRDEYPGTGVGLAITKTIVERHGGRIWLSANEPTGSRFWFTIPDVKEAE
jgi:signal transduction histidine kinase